MSEPAVRLEGVSRWYGQVLGVSDLNLTLPPGVVGLLGPNGAGKSTLMKMLAGLLPPSRGEVHVFGRSPWQDRDARRHIGYCPEHEGVYDELTGLEFVSAMAELSGMTPATARTRARAALVELGLEGAMDRRVGGYSKGMRQRAKLAQAFVHDPDFILLDEPLTGCDPIARAKIIEKIRGLAAAGKTILMSSHVLYEIESLTSQIVVIFRGQILAEGNVYRLRELIDEHPHRVRVECDQPRALAAALLAEAHVTRVSLSGEHVLELETRQPDALYDALPARARAAGVKLRGLSSPDNNIASVFQYLTEKGKR